MPTDTGIQLSFNAKAYRSATLLTAADAAAVTAATWILIPEVKDVKINLENSEGDITTREGAGFELTAAVLTKASIEISMPLKVDNTNYQALSTAFTAKTPIAMAFLSGLVANTNACGPAGNWSCVKMERDESIENVQMMSFTLKPYSYPSYFTK